MSSKFAKIYPIKLKTKLVFYWKMIQSNGRSDLILSLQKCDSFGHKTSEFFTFRLKFELKLADFGLSAFEGEEIC